MAPATKKRKTVASSSAGAKAPPPPAPAKTSKQQHHKPESASKLSSSTTQQTRDSIPSSSNVQKNKRKAAAVADESADDEDRPPAKAPMLKARVRTVPRATVGRWGVLDESSQADVMQMVKAAERPIIMANRKDKRKAEAQAITAKLVNRLGTLVKKMPAPAAPKDVKLDFEKLVTKNNELEALLEPYSHQLAELEAEIEREEEALRTDQQHLKHLEANAKAEETVRKEQAKNILRVLRADRQDEGSSSAEINLVDSGGGNSNGSAAAAATYRVDLDRQLRPLTTQLQQHLTSMQANTAQIGDVPEWILRGRAAIDEVFLRSRDERLHAAAFGA